MLSWRLLLRTGEPQYADLIERTLLNGIFVSPREDGRAFYYANTLHQRTAGEEETEAGLSERAEATLRAPWFEVSCCPTNVSRTLASLPGYVATSDDGGIQLHQYTPMELDATLTDGQRVGLRVATSYPFDEKVVISLTHDLVSPITLTLRVPAWAVDTAIATLNGEPVAVSGAVRRDHSSVPGGGCHCTHPADCARFTWPHPSIDAVRGQVAVESGPLVLAWRMSTCQTASPWTA